MQTPSFPSEEAALMKDVKRLLGQHAVDITRLWTRVGNLENGGPHLQGTTGCLADGCTYTPVVDVASPTGFGWSLTGNECIGDCSCSAVDGDFYTLYGYPADGDAAPLVIDCEAA